MTVLIVKIEKRVLLLDTLYVGLLEIRTDTDLNEHFNK